jgi:hypothetical protein
MPKYKLELECQTPECTMFVLEVIAIYPNRRSMIERGSRTIRRYIGSNVVVEETLYVERQSGWQPIADALPATEADKAAQRAELLDRYKDWDEQNVRDWYRYYQNGDGDYSTDEQETKGLELYRVGIARGYWPAST